MKKSLRDWWAATLRSGNYTQGARNLRGKKNECCCIGVLCDMVEPDKWTESYIPGVYVHDMDGPRHDDYSRHGFPSARFAKKVGLPNDVMGRLAYMNDDHGMTFSQIADAIEAWDGGDTIGGDSNHQAG